MEGALAKVHVTISINPTQELTKDFLSIILKDFIEKEQTLKKLTIREIQECICRKYSITISQILSTDRTASLVTPRQLAMYISRKYTTKSLQEIAAEFDKKHATILHGVKTIEKRLDVENDLKAVLEEILGEFGYSTADKME
jgi:chromosomal replication initiator protein